MKKIICLILTALLIMPTLCVCAADRTTAYVSDYNDINRKMIITIKCGDGFENATAYIGNETEHYIEGNGAGTYIAEIDLAGFNKSGKTEVKVVANYANDSDTVTKSVTVTKMKTTASDYTYDTINNQREVNTGTNTFEKVNETGTEVKLSFTESSLNSNNKRQDIRIGVSSAQNTNANPEGAIYTIEGEMLFKNDESSNEKEKPNIYLDFRARQDSNFSISSGYPTDGATGESVTDDAYGAIFGKDGKLSGGENYYTNVWYKFRFVFDIYTKNGDEMAGNVKTYIAENSGNGYGRFKLLKEFPNLIYHNIQQWRWEPTATGAASLTMKNFKLIKEEPINTWYINSAEYVSGKLNIEFSEDMGTLSGEDIKIYNENGDEIIITSITNTEGASYELTPKKTLKIGRKYGIYITNSKCSSLGNEALKEPETDEDGDNMWHLAEVTTPEYPLNISQITNNGTNVTVAFNNADISGKYACVCWYNEAGSLVDFKTLAVTGNQLIFERNNVDLATATDIYVFGANDDGSVDIYDTHSSK